MTDQPEESAIPPQAIDTSSAMRCYVLLGLGMIIGFMNLQLVSSVGVLAMLIGIVWAYRIRKASEKDGLVWNHAQWMIRTFWVSSVYAVIAMILWSSLVYSNADFSSLEQYKEMIKTGQVEHGLIEESANNFAKANRSLMTGATIGFHGPVILFVLARFVKGYRLADMGKPIENLKSWKL